MILGIYGSNGMGRELREIALLINEKGEKKTWSEIIFIDDSKEKGEFKKCPMMPFADVKNSYKKNEIEIVIGVGEPQSKQLIWERVKESGFSFARVIHPDAEVVPSATLGEGVVVRKGAIVSSDSLVGNNVIVQSNVVIGHDSKIGNHCQISSFTDVAGHCTIGDRVFIGLGACIKEKTYIGNDAVLSMGSIVMKNVNEKEIVMGNPARVVSKNESGRVFR